MWSWRNQPGGPRSGAHSSCQCVAAGAASSPLHRCDARQHLSTAHLPACWTYGRRSTVSGASDMSMLSALKGNVGRADPSNPGLPLLRLGLAAGSRRSQPAGASGALIPLHTHTHSNGG